MFVVDTNVLLHAANRDSPHHGRAMASLEEWRREPGRWCFTWPIAYEFLRVATHRSVFPRPLRVREAWSFVAAVLDSPGVEVLGPTDRHPDVLAELVAECPWVSGNLAHDLHTVALMREHGVREIRTADSDFLKFRFLRVLNPLEG